MNLELAKELSIQNWIDLGLEAGGREIIVIRKHNVDTGAVSQDKIFPSGHT